MNWVGGSRNRLVMRNDAKKQREFFEKRKMQQKLKNLGISLPTSSPGDGGSASMDLMTLFMVNQIAAKKACKDPPKVAVFGSCKRGSKHKRNEPIVLPMSPCSPSQLSLVESQPHYSVQGIRKRKTVIPQGFKCRQLSPVLESALSDSGSDYCQPITDPVGPFSSTPSASSSGRGMFPLQLDLQKQQPPPHFSPAPWDKSLLEQAKFQPFSQPRVMTDTTPWSCGTNKPFFKLRTPTAARVLFGSPEQHKSEEREAARHAAPFPLSQPEDTEPLMDFTFSQSGAKEPFQEDVFSGFSHEDCESEASRFASAKSKIYLTDKTPIRSSTPQTVPDPECMGMELSNCTDTSFSCLGHNSGPRNGLDDSPSYPCSRGCLSSDSNDDEECCQPCLQACVSCRDCACSADTLNTNDGFQRNLEQTQSRPLSPLIKPKVNFKDEQKVLENTASPHRVCESKGHDDKSSTAQFLSPQTSSSKLCDCKKTSTETQDAGTQTADSPAAETRDASTQCGFVSDSGTEAPGFSFYLPNVDMSEQRLATGRQIDAATEPDALAQESRSEGSMKTRKPGSLSDSNKFTAANCGRVTPQRHANPFPDVSSETVSGGNENGKSRDERGHRENGPLMKDPSATRVNGLSEEAETLQEIADILILLKQRKNEG
ncbi:uncharacterized protein LOC124999784 isoform X2 [Mugil cephalus]|uniref:uncharacterized protein LOC124999784 isoform X2 n=1 Tax=Mugil cephalus TaxID=48193 RepID=UPI001FB5C8B0|nr:uncharacterized protein LOC124999784 isoform X2 [Mugil cephalus]